MFMLRVRSALLSFTRIVQLLSAPPFANPTSKNAAINTPGIPVTAIRKYPRK